MPRVSYGCHHIRIKIPQHPIPIPSPTIPISTESLLARHFVAPIFKALNKLSDTTAPPPCSTSFRSPIFLRSSMAIHHQLGPANSFPPSRFQHSLPFPTRSYPCFISRDWLPPRVGWGEDQTGKRKVDGKYSIPTGLLREKVSLWVSCAMSVRPIR